MERLEKIGSIEVLTSKEVPFSRIGIGFEKPDRAVSDRVKIWEIWNEPDGRWCWKHGPSAAEYAAFSVDTAKAVREADPGAYVVGGAVTYRSINLSPKRWRAVSQTPWTLCPSTNTPHARRPCSSASAS